MSAIKKPLLFVISLGLLALSFISESKINVSAQTSGITYYVDCNGVDTNEGRSPSTAWKTIKKANTASLLPGDKLLFKRDCTFPVSSSISGQTRLEADWSGTLSAPITIGAYGVGDKPTIRSDAHSTSTNETNVWIEGNYLIIEDIKTDTINYHLDPTCLYSDGTAARQGWYAGFTVRGNNNVLRNIEATNMAVGVSLTDSSNNNRLYDSHFYNLNTFTRIFNSGGALGSMGVILHGTQNEAYNNLFEASLGQTQCTETAASTNPGNVHNYSAPFEVFNANKTYVHHNKAFGHRKHFEMGKSSGLTSSDNVVAYNLFVSDQPGARGPNIHGNDVFGPVNNTQIYHNTIVFTGLGSQALIASSTGSARNNIFIAEGKAAFLSTNMVANNNLYWDYQKTSDTTKDPCVQIAGGGCLELSTINDANPLFLNSTVPSGDFHLSVNSPAVDIGVSLLSINTLSNILSRDLDGNIVPQGITSDLGAYEYRSNPTSSPLPSTPPLSPSPSLLIIPGDANNDQRVDETDYTIWLSHYGLTTAAGASDGDFDGDSKVNGVDYAIWRLNSN